MENVKEVVKVVEEKEIDLEEKSNKPKIVPRNVRFDYYQLVCVQDVKNDNDKGNAKKKEKLFDFIQWMNQLNDVKKLEDRTINYNAENIRVDDIRIEPKTKYGLVHFSRLRETNVPSITTITDNKSEDVKLKANEYLSEDISGLYDSENHVVMLQRNIHSLSPTGVEKYINYFWNLNHKDEYIDLRPVMVKEAFKKGIGKKHYEKISFKTANLSENDFDKLAGMKTSFSSIFKEINTFNGVNIELTIGVSTKKEDHLDRTEAIQALEEIKSNQKLFKKVQIATKDTEEGKIERYDLINGKVFSVLPFEIPTKTSLNYNSVQTSMLNEYNPKVSNKKKEVDDNLKRN